MDSIPPVAALRHARCKKRKAHLALGMILMASMTIASAQSLVREELGDASVGLVAGISVLSATQPVTPPQGKLLIAPLKKNPSLNRELSLDLLASEKGDPPRRYFQRYEIAVDRQLHQTTQVHPWMLPYYTTALPYAPKTVGVTGFLSTGESFSTTVEVPASLPVNRTLDIRTNEVTQPSDLYGKKYNEASPVPRLDTPYRDQIVYWVGNVSGGGGALTIQAACLGSKAAGRIVYTRLTIKKHYYYSPDGDMTLMETTFHQPIYGTDEGVDFAMPRYPVFNPDGVRSLRARQPDDRGDDPNNPYPARFVFECRTETGKVMQREFEYRYRARRFSSPGQ